jgi:hypothetical protein
MVLTHLPSWQPLPLPHSASATHSGLGVDAATGAGLGSHLPVLQAKPSLQSVSVAHSAHWPETQIFPKPAWPSQSLEVLHSPFLGGEGQAVRTATKARAAKV